jgi:Ser/Thr protein kinase RdoA (MazF antagonist)
VDFLNLQERQPVPDTSGPDTDPLATEFFPVTHSLLSSEALGSYIQAAYALGEVRACVLLQHNLNDTYIVDTTMGRYILRVSQARRPNRWSWRTSEDIFFELDVLLHLSRKGVPVAAPLAQRDGTYISVVHAPEGERHLVLFTYAQGEPLTPSKQTEPLARGYGGAVAQLHTATDDFTSTHPRFALDLDFLLAKPLDVLHPYLAHRPADWHYLRRLGTSVTERLAALQALARRLDSGLCHGDAQGGNAHMTLDGTINFFDFDVCGIGWRAYDIAVFFWGAALGQVRVGWDTQTVERLCAAYLSGYQERRPLGLADHEAIAPLLLLRQYWYLGMEAGNWDTWGISDARREAFFDRELKFMREWEAEHHIPR